MTPGNDLFHREKGIPYIEIKELVDLSQMKEQAWDREAGELTG